MKKEEAVALFDSKFWESMSYRDRAVFQMHEPRLCMPFDVFHEAVEKTLGRPVFTHEFSMNKEGLQRELMGEQAAPTFDEILALIPQEKLMLVTISRE